MCSLELIMSGSGEAAVVGWMGLIVCFSGWLAGTNQSLTRAG